MTIFLATSKKFYPQVKQLIERIRKPGLTIYHPYFDFDPDQIEQDEHMKERITLDHFPEIDACDLLFALLPDGYIGTSVTIEITYAYAKGKYIVVSEPPKEFAVRALVNEICDVDDFVGRMQHTWVIPAGERDENSRVE